jgi:hypothetical protein
LLWFVGCVRSCRLDRRPLGYSSVKPRGGEKNDHLDSPSCLECHVCSRCGHDVGVLCYVTSVYSMNFLRVVETAGRESLPDVGIAVFKSRRAWFQVGRNRSPAADLREKTSVWVWVCSTYRGFGWLVEVGGRSVTPLAIGFLRLASWRLPGIPDLETHKREHSSGTKHDTIPSTFIKSSTCRRLITTAMSTLRYQTAKPRAEPAEVQCV